MEESTSTFDVPQSWPPLSESGLQGVGGWLLLFCVLSTVVGPGILIPRMFSHVSAIADISIWQWAQLLLTLFGAATGVALGASNRLALSLLRVFLALVAARAIFFFLWLCLRAAMHGTALNTVTISPVLGSLASVAVWGTYFQRSARVKATFGSNLF